LQLIIDATGLLDIDFFSLDVEGGEKLVLEPWTLGRPTSGSSWLSKMGGIRRKISGYETTWQSKALKKWRLALTTLMGTKVT
jgi:hypothetical protein